MQPLPKRTIKCAPKVSTGCASCKRRRIKCDEQRPECIRCIRHGIRCGGYYNALQAPDPTPLPSLPTAQLLLSRECNRSPVAERALEYFYTIVYQQIAGFWYPDFWRTVVPNAASSDRLVQHAVISLSLAYESIIETTSSRQEAVEIIAFESSTQAIGRLAACLDNIQTSIALPLIACAILVCVACIRKDIEQARMHINGGCYLLQQRRLQIESTIDDESFDYPDARLVEYTMLPMFYWLQIVSSVHSNGLFNPFGSTACDVKNMIALRRQLSEMDVDVTFLELTSETHKIAHEHNLRRYLPDWSPQITVEAQVVHDKWDVWRAILEIQQGSSDSSSFDVRMNVLIAAQVAAQAWLNVCSSPLECAWDAYKASFEEILDRLTRVIDYINSKGTKGHLQFALEPNLIFLLQIVIWKCRFPMLRRKALLLLRAAPANEFLLSSSFGASLCQRIMLLEEADIMQNESPLNSTLEVLPSESARIHAIEVAPLPPDSRGKVFNFKLKPHGIHAPWQIRSERVPVDRFPELKWLRACHTPQTSNVDTDPYQSVVV